MFKTAVQRLLNCTSNKVIRCNNFILQDFVVCFLMSKVARTFALSLPTQDLAFVFVSSLESDRPTAFFQCSSYQIQKRIKEMKRRRGIAVKSIPLEKLKPFMRRLALLSKALALS